MSLELYVKGRMARARLTDSDFSLAVVRNNFVFLELEKYLTEELNANKGPESDLVIPHKGDYVVLLNGAAYTAEDELSGQFSLSAFRADRMLDWCICDLAAASRQQRLPMNVSVGVAQYELGMSVDDLLAAARSNMTTWRYEPSTDVLGSVAYRPRDTKKVDMLQPVA